VKIKSIQAIPFQQERDAHSSTGTAGSPAKLEAGSSPYQWAENYPVIYSRRFETAIVRVELDSGLIGWGESQAPVAPEVACAVVNHILAPVLQDLAFDGVIDEIEALWWKMYSSMRVRGQTGGFMLDGIAGVDLALWDLAGKIAKAPVSALLGCHRDRVPAYLSGLPGGDPRNVAPWTDAGFTNIKVFHDATVDRLLNNLDGLASLQVAVDALWRLTPESALELAPELAARSIQWLEAPLAPESAQAHGTLASAIVTPIAIGESYRTMFELDPFFAAGAMKIVQPDLGRTGITGGLRIARAAEAHGITVIPHVSIALGPQIAAAIHFAASIPNCPMLEFNPSVLTIANQYLKDPLQVEGANYLLPDSAGLGVNMSLNMTL
jgi:D-galactarolactone cycloisomerase